MTENSDIKSTDNMPRPRRRALVLILAIAALVVLAALTMMYLHNRPEPSTGLGEVELGMREMDVTLAYGRSPDCIISESPTQKVWGYYYIEECRAKLYFTNEGSEFRLSTICGAGITESVNYADSEEDVLRKLGSPSFVSVSHDGTQKLSSFEKYNVAFTFQAGDLKEICVSNELPLRFENEYPGS